MSWLLQLKIWSLGIQLKNKEKRILHLEKQNAYLILRENYPIMLFDSSHNLYKYLR